jgi:hypothetical protein
MALIEWRESYKIGIRSIDYEHENLIWVINDLLGCQRRSNLGPAGRSKKGPLGSMGSRLCGVSR